MHYDFDEIIDRRHAEYSYSVKWAVSPLLAGMLGADTIDDDTIAMFTADAVLQEALERIATQFAGL